MVNVNNIKDIFKKFVYKSQNKETNPVEDVARDVDREINLPEDVRLAIKSIKSRSDFIKKYYSSAYSPYSERKERFLKIADTLSGVEEVISREDVGSITGLFSIANDYNKSMSSLLRRFQNSGAFLAFPNQVDNCLSSWKEMVEIGNYLFETTKLEGTFDPVSLVDYLNDFSGRDYRLIKIKTPLLAKLVGNSKLEDKLRSSAFEKLEQLSEIPTEFKEGNENYQNSIGRGDLTYFDFVLREVIVSQNKSISGFRKLPRDEVVNDALKQIGLYKDCKGGSEIK